MMYIHILINMYEDGKPIGTVEGPDQTSSKPCIDIYLSATALLRMSNVCITPRNTRVSTQHQHYPFGRGWSYLTWFIQFNVNEIILVVWTYFKINTLLFLWWRVWMRLMIDMILFMCKWQKSMHSSFDFFTSQCTYFSGSCIVQNEKNRRMRALIFVICTTTKSYSVINL